MTTPRGKPFESGQSGNPAGRPKGARNRATVALEAILDGDAESILRKAVSLAQDGDPAALRMCLDRIIPVRKDRPVRFDLPEIDTADDVKTATAAIVRAVAAGEISPSEAQDVAAVLELHRRALDTSELAARVAALEAAQPNRGA